MDESATESFVGNRRWFAASAKNQTCDTVCASNNQRTCTDTDFTKVTNEEIKTLFETLLPADKCKCMVQSIAPSVNSLVPYFGGGGGASCTPGPASEGCVFARQSNTVSTCES